MSNIKEQTIIISQRETGYRLDKFLKQTLNNISRHKLVNYIKKGLILVNHNKVKPSHRLKIGDIVTYPYVFPEENSQIIPLSFTPEPAILYEDKNILVINKPSHILVHPTRASLMNPSIASWLIYKYPEIINVGEDPLRPGIVHRLDKDTSGALILTKNQKSFDYFKTLFIQRKINKTYLVLVKGQLKQRVGIIAYNIGQSKKYPKRKIILIENKDDTKFSQQAITYYQVLKIFNNYTLLEVKPKTGRTHQIRVHFASIGFPVAGDRLYGKIKFKEKNAFPRQMIHALKVSFPNLDGKFLTIEAPLPVDFVTILNQLTKEGTL